MKTLFEVTPFNRRTFSPRMEGWFSDLWSEAKEFIDPAKEIYESYTSAEKAEEERKAAEARAAAAAAQAKAAESQAKATTGSTVLGIPTTYVVVGTLGLVAIGLVAFMVKK